MLHLFERLRPGQVRGVPWFAPAIARLRDLDEYDDAELVRKKIEACFAAFVTGDEDGATLGASSTDAEGRRIERFEPGMIEYLPSGKDVRFATPGASGGYAEYMRVQLHAIAAGVGLTYLPLKPDAAHLFFQLVSRRYEKGAMLITSNRTISEWGTVFGDAVVATAILDQLLHHSHVVTIRGDSYRLRAAPTHNVTA